MQDLPNQIAVRTYRCEGLLFNVFCATYFLFFAAGVTGAADVAMRDPEGVVIWLGILLAAISLAETWAFPVKMRFVNEAIRDNGDSAGRAFYLWMFHTVISVILLFLIAGSFGFKATGGKDGDLPWWLGVLIFITVIKELVFLGFLWISPEEREKPNPKYTRPKRKEWIADAILIVYACVAYSATWGAITKDTDMGREHPVLFTMNVFLMVFLFLIFYLPLRIPYWVEEMAQVKTAKDAWRLVGSILIVLVPAVVTSF